MAYLLKPEMLAKMTEPADVKKLMKQDLKNAAGKEVKFVAVKNWKIGSTHMNLFIVTDVPDKFVTLIKQNGSPTHSTGVAGVSLAQGKTKVIVKKAAGGITHEDVAKLVTPSVGDTSIVASTPEEEREQATKEHEEAELANRPKPNALEMARASHEEVGNFGWKPDKAAIAALAEATRQMPEYKKFKAAFDNFMSKYKLSNDGKLPTDIWDKMFQSMYTSEYKTTRTDIEKVGDRFKLRVDGPGATKVREKALAKAMEGLKPFTEHAGKYLDKVIAQTESGKPWVFWSGTGAMDAARASGGISLEGTVGSFFDEIKNEDWGPLLGADQATIPLWAALSEMYAAKGAEHFNKFKYQGYVGPGANNEHNVFNSIEQPTLLEVLNAKATVKAPHIDWYVVLCDPNGSGWWKPNGKLKEFDSRQAALDYIKQEYKS